MHILIEGNPVDGFKFTAYPDHEAASLDGDSDKVDWWVVPLATKGITVLSEGGWSVVGYPPEIPLLHVWDGNLSEEGVASAIAEAREAGWVQVQEAEQTRPGS